jgi:hypothetical protein
MGKYTSINKWVRLGYTLMPGILFKFVLDVIYSLVYRNYTLKQPVLDYFISVISIFIVLETLIWYNQKLEKRTSWNEHLVKRFFVQFLSNALIAIFIFGVLRWSVRYIQNDLYYIRLLDEMIINGLVIFVVFILAVINLSVFLMYKWRFSLAELERFKKENAEFRFESLRSQVNPHFLFNSLNTLSSLVYESQEKAEQFIRELSDVYRYVLENRENEMISLDKEFIMAKSYIYLNQIRFGQNLKVNINTDGSLKQYMIPPLTLQLLIENAIKHNIISEKKPLTLHISQKGDYLTVSNNMQKKESKEYSSQLGLKNIKSRYSFLTEKEVGIFEKETEFSVKIPLLIK